MLENKKKLDKNKIKYAAYVNAMYANGQTVEDDEEDKKIEGKDIPANPASIGWLMGS